MKWLKWIGIVLGVLVVVLCAAIGTVFAVSQRRFDRRWDVAGHALTINHDSATVARGRHLVQAVVKCVDCHGPDLAGTRFIDDPALGLVVASNLTSGQGGVGKMYDDVAFERALRHGVRRDGAGLRVMPSFEMQNMADDDVAAIIAYLRAVPPVDKILPATSLRLLARVLYVAGELPIIDAERIDQAARPPASMPFAPTREYGAYFARINGCLGCHGEGLSGGKIPGTPPDWPPAANITPTGLAQYQEADFMKLLRTGVRPSGVKVSDVMPWRLAKDLTDDEIHVLWLYLQGVPKREFGGH
ncbi:MAG: cytochrome c [Gemmatimonadetes bacterium]|nr:cytochrome c [Gemmatimonadota bacterium]